MVKRHSALGSHFTKWVGSLPIIPSFFFNKAINDIRPLHLISH